MEFSTGEMTAGLKHPYSMNVSLKGQAEKLRIVCLQEISLSMPARNLNPRDCRQGCSQRKNGIGKVHGLILFLGIFSSV